MWKHLLTEAWIDAVERKFAQISGGRELPDHFQCVGLMFDGLRQPLARSSEELARGATYSGYTESHTALWGILVSPDGIVRVASGPVVGRDSDFTTVSDALCDALERIEVCAVGDQAFDVEHASVLVALPKDDNSSERGITRRDRSHMSKIRAAVEWMLGSLQSKFPLAFQPETNRIMAGAAPRVTRVSIILLNAITCCTGNECTTYFELEPPDLDAYMARGRRRGGESESEGEAIEMEAADDDLVSEPSL